MKQQITFETEQVDWVVDDLLAKQAGIIENSTEIQTSAEMVEDDIDEEYYCCGQCPCCGYSNCECECVSDSYCDACECDPCECGEGHGYRDVAPWVERGVVTQPDNIIRSDNWHETWPEIDISVDPISEAGNYYLLEAMSSNVVFPTLKIRNLAIPSAEIDREFFELIGLNEAQQEAFVKARNEQIEQRLASDPTYKMADLSVKAGEMLSDLVERLDPTFVHYSHMAIAGEARHHKALGGRWFRGHREQAWVEWRPLYEKLGNQGILDLAELFLEFGEETAFGGKKWADACKVLYNRLEGRLGPDDYTNKRLFIDRVFTLEHNGGAFLNKIGWNIRNRRRWAVGYIKSVLDAHASDDFKALYAVADKSVRELFKEYCEAAVTILGDDHPAWMDTLIGNQEPRALCNECWSNPKLGHLARCYMLRNSHRYDDFDGIVDLGVPKSWYSIVDPDDFDDYNWDEWYPDDSGHVYAHGPKGAGYSRTATVKVDFYYSITSSERGYYEGNKTYTTTFGDIADGKFKISLKQFNKKAGPIGTVKNAWCSYTARPGTGWDTLCSESVASGPWKPAQEMYEKPIQIMLPTSVMTRLTP